MPSKKTPSDINRQDRIIAEARRNRERQELTYRANALKIFPWICARCGREVSGKKLRELTVHHKDHNHDNNPPDGSNWELLCLYCHDNEHSRHEVGEAYGEAAPDGEQASPSIQRPFANLEALLKNKKNKVDLENVWRELARVFQGVLSWQWESRFETILAEFAVDNKNSIRSILEQYLGNTWDSSTIGNAPGIVQTITDQLGGLMPGQLLFTSDPGLDTLMFCAWWPWGDGKTISIRLAPAYEKSLDLEKAEQINRFRGWFEL